MSSMNKPGAPVSARKTVQTSKRTMNAAPLKRSIQSFEDWETEQQQRLATNRAKYVRAVSSFYYAAAAGVPNPHGLFHDLDIGASEVRETTELVLQALAGSSPEAESAGRYKAIAELLADLALE